MKILIDLQGAQTQSRMRGIGRFTRDLLRALLGQVRAGSEIHVALSSPLDEGVDGLFAELRTLLPRERIHYVRLPYRTGAHAPDNAWRSAAAARLMRHAIDVLDPDVVWHTSVVEGWGEDAVVPDATQRRAATVATFYDLLPLNDPATYLPTARVQQWYRQRMDVLARADTLLAISKWARDEAIERLRLDPAHVVNMGSAVDAMFRPERSDAPTPGTFLQEIGIDRPFVLYNGGYDARKNVPALVDAFANLPDEVRQAHQLVLVGKVPPPLRDALKRKLGEEEIVFTGYASDDALVRLYGLCALFVFPSKMEGFGLPPLEAMACGAPVVCSSASSLPEVVGRADMMFDPERSEAITERMLAVLGNPAFAQELRRYGLERAKTFSWNAIASRAVEAMKELDARRRQREAAPATAPTSRPALLLVSATTQEPIWLEDLRTDQGVVDAGPIAPDALHGLLVRHPGAQVLYAVDTSAPDWIRMLARQVPGVVLVTDVDVPASVSADQQQRLAYLGGGYRGVVNAAASREPVVALADLIERGVGLVAASEDQLQRILAANACGRRFPHIALAQVTAGACRDAVALCYESSLVPCEMDVIADIATLPGEPTRDDLAQAAFSISAAGADVRARQWLVDVTGIAQSDIGTGVQRVVRNVLKHWLRNPPNGIRIEPVRFVDGHYRYAHQYALALLGIEVQAPWEEEIASAHRGDTFIGLDWAAESLGAARNRLQDWRRGGVECCFIVYDLLPLRLPEFFHSYSRTLSEQWLRNVSFLADRALCISQATAHDLEAWLAMTSPAFQFGSPPRVQHFRLGADAPRVSNAVQVRPELAAAMSARESLLMVGTIEPRKGHSRALDAFETLWREGTEVNLVMVGKRGWMTEALIARLDRHPERDRRLFWFEDVRDDELDAIYSRSDALLALSEGEGYGLPLIEAAQHGVPVIARDLDVFREVAGEEAYYLGADAEGWPHEIRAWLQAPRPGAPTIRWPDWGESADELAALILGRG